MTFMIPELIQYFFLNIILHRITRTLKFISRCKSFTSENFKIHVLTKNPDSKLPRKQLSFIDKNAIEDESVRRDDVEFVMGNLGIFCDSESKKLSESLNSSDVFNMFEDEQPRLDEIKGAFDVFDENKDGFIDARELQRVLSALGLKDRAAMDDCKKMIRVFDENADGRIDFHEFVKFMENTFC